MHQFTLEQKTRILINLIGRSKNTVNNRRRNGGNHQKLKLAQLRKKI
jgi:hypothetical protein